MLYRKAAPQPIRLLLRVVAVAGAGSVLGAVACSSDDNPCHEGSCVSVPADAADEYVFSGVVDGGSDGHLGVVPNPDGGDEHVVTGVVPNPDGGDEHVVGGMVDAGGGVVPLDASDDGPVGVVVHPDGGGDGA